MDLDTLINRERLISYFPLLGTDPQFVITSNTTPIYNCIAWAMGFTDRWVEVADKISVDIPGGKFVWWPAGIEQTQRPEALQAAFEAVGFEICSSTNYEAGYDKAVLYCKDKNWTHASRLISDNEEHSKFGESWNAHHGRNKFTDTIYGDPFCFMRRRHDLKLEFLHKFPLKLGSITINKDKAKPIINMLRAKLGLPPTPPI